jgi:hypothetical protein
MRKITTEKSLIPYQGLLVLSPDTPDHILQDESIHTEKMLVYSRCLSKTLLSRRSKSMAFRTIPGEEASNPAQGHTAELGSVESETGLKC